MKWQFKRFTVLPRCFLESLRRPKKQPISLATDIGQRNASNKSQISEESQIFELIRGILALLHFRAANSSHVSWINPRIDEPLLRMRLNEENVDEHIFFRFVFHSDGYSGRIYDYLLGDETVQFSEMTRDQQYDPSGEAPLSRKKYEVLYKENSFRGQVIYDPRSPMDPNITVYRIEHIEGDLWIPLFRDLLAYEASITQRNLNRLSQSSK